MPPEVPSAATGSLPFVGRERERAELDQALAGARAGEGGLVLVVGEAGIGKTRLAEDFAARAQAGGARVLWGRAWERSAPPFGPWVEVLRGLLEAAGPGSIVAALGERAHALPRLLPELARHLPSGAARAGLEPDRDRFFLFDAVAAALGAAAARAPTVVALDDFHAADPASVLLLRFVVRRLSATHLLLLVLAREPVADLAYGRRLALRGLDEAHVGALVRGRTGREPAAELVRALHEGTGGNPLFVDEVVRLLLAEGRLDHGSPPGGLPVPEGVREAIRGRCAPLAAEVRETLRLAALLGVDFELPVLARLTALPTGQLLDRLAAAVAAGLLVPVAGPSGRASIARRPRRSSACTLRTSNHIFPRSPITSARPWPAPTTRSAPSVAPRAPPSGRSRSSRRRRRRGTANGRWRCSRPGVGPRRRVRGSSCCTARPRAPPGRYDGPGRSSSRWLKPPGTSAPASYSRVPPSASATRASSRAPSIGRSCGCSRRRSGRSRPPTRRCARTSSGGSARPSTSRPSARGRPPSRPRRWRWRGASVVTTCSPRRSSAATSRSGDPTRPRSAPRSRPRRLPWRRGRASARSSWSR